MTTSMASTTVVRDRFQFADSWKMPRAMAATKARGRLSIRAITAAASVRRSRALPAPETLANDANPTIGTRRIAAVAESSPATAHTIVESRATGTPSRPARSPFSAAARMAMP